MGSLRGVVTSDRPQALDDPTLGRALPPLPELLEDLVVVQLPLVTRFRGITVRETALVRGPLGWAEFAPFTEYDDAEASRWLSATLEAGWWGWPDPVREAVEVNATVPAVEAGQVPGVLARFPGCTTAKIKVAEQGALVQDAAQLGGVSDRADRARIAAAREVLGEGAALRLDANGAWSVPHALDFLTRLAEDGERLEYVEQPCATVEELADLREGLARRGVSVRIAADESIRRAQDPLRVRELAAADVVVVKAAPLGGVSAARQVLDAAGLPVVVSSALESSVGLASGVALAATVPALQGACGLGTVRLLAEDVTTDSLSPVGGRIDLRRVEPDRRVALAAPERREWWADRLSRCHRLLRRGQIGRRS